MDKEKVWVILDVTLLIAASLLLLNFFGVQLPTLGHAQYWLSPDDSVCMVKNLDGEFNQWADIDRCCLLATHQLPCQGGFQSINGQSLTTMCPTGNGIEYWLNNKAFNYCSFQPTR
jgi:hypothetical protein